MPSLLNVMKEKDILKEIKEILKDITQVYHCGLYREDGINYLRIELEGQVDTTLCEHVSQALESFLDENQDLLPKEYLLDVCSSGAEKVIYDLEMLSNYLNQYVFVSFKQKMDKLISVEGYLKTVENDLIVIEYRHKHKTNSLSILKDNIKLIRLAIKI